MRLTITAQGAYCFFLMALNASPAFIGNPSLLDGNDTVVWSELGNPGVSVSASFNAVSANGVEVAAILGGSGTIAEVCPAVACNWAAAPGFNAGDSLLWTEDAAGAGTGPLTILFSTPVKGAGLWFQLTAPGTFVVIFADLAGGTSHSENVVGDAAGDPVFVGALDAASDITAVTISASSCVPGSPGGCLPTDFAAGRLDLVDAVPEPATLCLAVCGLFALVVCRYRFSQSNTRRAGKALLLACSAIPCFFAKPTFAQGTSPIEARDRISVHIARPIDAPSPVGAVAAAPQLPIWRYQITSPVNGVSYGGYMVGANPFFRGARTITIPVILIPFIVELTNTASGFTATFDPSSAPDAACTAGQTAMSLVENSPIFQSRPWTLNGVDVGTTQYVDAFQRSNFWQYVRNTGDAYHTLLTWTLGEPLTLPLSYASPTLTAEVRVGAQTSCTNPTGSGSVNGAGYQGIVDFNVLVAAMSGYIASHQITPDQFPIFILYNVMYSQDGLLYLGGYHFSEASYPAALVSPGQTFAMANFRTNGVPPYDVSILSHEIGEWMNDPGGYNAVPAWGNIGEVTGCKRALEVGDPLTQTDLPPITGPNGFAYHLQELAYFSWFFRTQSIAAGGLFSDNGTLATNAGPVCQ